MSDIIVSRRERSEDPASLSGPDSSRSGTDVKRRNDGCPAESSKKMIACTPIASLTCTQSCPRISGRLISASEWGRTSRGALYSNFLLEDDSGRIGGVIFRTESSSFEKEFVAGATLTVANAVVKPVKRTYREKSVCKYELSIPNTLRTVTILPSAKNRARAISEQENPNQRILIRDVVEKIKPRELVNVIGAITEVEDVKNIHGDRQNTITRDFRIIDESEMEIAVTIWNERATRFKSPVGAIVDLHQVAVRFQPELKIKSLTFQKNSRMLLDPPGDDVDRLRIWYDEWKFGRGSLKKYAGIAAEIGPRNCNSCAGDAPMQQPETIEMISERIIPATDSIAIARPGSPLASTSRNIRAKINAPTSTSSACTARRREFVADSSSGQSDDDAGFAVPVHSNFTKIAEINEATCPGVVDVLGVIKCRSDTRTVMCTASPIAEFMVELLDETRQSIWMIIPDSVAEHNDERENLIVAARNVRVRCSEDRKVLDCKGKTSSLIFEPEIDEAKELRNWFESGLTDGPIEVPRAIVPVTVIGDLENGQVASILGILMKADEAKVISSKYIWDVGRVVRIMDCSYKMIRVALWGDLAQDFALPEGSIVYATNVKIYRSDTIDGALTSSSRVTTDPPEFEEAISRLRKCHARWKYIESLHQQRKSENSRILDEN